VVVDEVLAPTLNQANTCLLYAMSLIIYISCTGLDYLALIRLLRQEERLS
jgi:hypothetical protein